MQNSSKFQIGFIGLGLMGRPMALNILKAGFPLAVFNRTKNKTEEFRKLGCKIYKSPKELAANSSVPKAILKEITILIGEKKRFMRRLKMIQIAIFNQANMF